MNARVNPQVNIAVLARRIQPQGGELSAARRHLLTVRRRLAASFFISKIVPIGSHTRGTAIRWYSDLDVMAVLRRNEAKWGGNFVASSTLLRRVRDDLQDRYVYTNVRGDQQAVVLGFAAGQQSLDIVPAVFVRIDKPRRILDSQRPIYAIPDGNGDWLETSPEAHSRFFALADQRSGGKLRRLIQLLKWWKFSRAQPIPIRSFHLELLLADSEICVGVRPYTYCLYEAFKLLVSRECRGFRDPVGIAGTVDAAQTEVQREVIYGAADFALDHSRAALIAEGSKDFEEANRQWSIVFNGEY